ncbi:hypothetical protein GCM10011318_09910 [Phaeocystidibacter marisrubri]|nr:hypothetical protein GCM10011318_09910 [Phaeocystidibacter marisrubri]
MTDLRTRFTAMKINALSALVLLGLCSTSCSHPYFELTQPVEPVQFESVDQANFVLDVDSSNVTFVGSFYTNRRSPLEDLQDTILSHAREIGANAIYLRELRELRRGGYIIKGDLYRSESPISPIFDTLQQQIVFIREESDEYSCILRMGDTLEINLPNWSYVVFNFDNSVREIEFSINRIDQKIGLDGRDKMIGVQSGMGGSQSGNISVVPVYSGGGVGMGVFFPLSSSSRFINHVSMYAEFNPMVMVARMTQCKKLQM